MSLSQKNRDLETELAQTQAKLVEVQGELTLAHRVIFEQQEQIRQLEAKLARANKDSGNSSKPPSSDLVKPPPTKTGSSRSRSRKIGGQRGHPRHQRPAFTFDQIDNQVFHGPEECPNCGSTDLEVLAEPSKVHQQVDLSCEPITVTEHVVQSCQCRNCHRIQAGTLPPAIAATGLIGPRMMGLLLYMKGAMRASYTVMEEFLEQVLGFKVSRGYLAKVMAQGSQALHPAVEELRCQLPTQPWLNVDETGHKENGKGLWTWCFRAPDFVLYSIQESRGSDVLMEFLGTEFAGVLGCDYFSAYRKFMGKMSGTVQFCFAHLIRDLKFLAEHPDPVIQIYAQPILRGVKEMFRIIHKQVEKPTKDFVAKLERQKQCIIALVSGIDRVSPIEWYVRENYPEVYNMAQRFQKHGQEYFNFITTPGVGPTNNAAEQALRFVVMDRKATQGTRGHKGRAFCERIWTVVGTCRMNKRRIFDYLCQVVQAWAGGLQIPSLLPKVDSS